MANFYWTGEFLGQNWGKRRLFWLGKEPLLGLCKEEFFFGPEHSLLSSESL